MEKLTTEENIEIISLGKSSELTRGTGVKYADSQCGRLGNPQD